MYQILTLLCLQSVEIDVRQEVSVVRDIEDDPYQSPKVILLLKVYCSYYSWTACFNSRLL